MFLSLPEARELMVAAVHYATDHDGLAGEHGDALANAIRLVSDAVVYMEDEPEVYS